VPLWALSPRAVQVVGRGSTSSRVLLHRQCPPCAHQVGIVDSNRMLVTRLQLLVLNFLIKYKTTGPVNMPGNKLEIQTIDMHPSTLSSLPQNHALDETITSQHNNVLPPTHITFRKHGHI
jgi:hypothetical protein